MLRYENRSELFSIYQSDSISFPLHLHTYIEMIYIREDEMKVTIDRKEFLLQKGDFAIIFPNRIHSYETTDHSLSVIALFPIEMSGDYLNHIVKRHPQNAYIKADSLHPDIPYLIDSMLSLSVTKENAAIMKAYVQLIFALTFPQYELIKNVDIQSPDCTETLLSFLSEHFTESITLDILAERLGISRYSVSRIFSEKLKTSFSNYLNTLRIDYARTLLKGTDESILSISMSCGYETQRTFNREFKQICGCNPRDYRNLYKT